ncbi:hypothetical protein VP01_788g4, partial [Puccinia sorghi]
MRRGKGSWKLFGMLTLKETENSLIYLGVPTGPIISSLCTSPTPFLLQLNKKSTKQPYSIELQTFFHSRNVIVTGNSVKNILFPVNLNPLNLLVSNLKNKNKLSGRMSGIGFCGGYEQGKTSGKYNFESIYSDQYANSSFPSGTYAVRTNFSSAQVSLDKKLQQKFPCHNQFVSQCGSFCPHDARPGTSCGSRPSGSSR